MACFNLERSFSRHAPRWTTWRSGHAACQAFRQEPKQHGQARCKGATLCTSLALPFSFVFNLLKHQGTRPSCLQAPHRERGKSVPGCALAGPTSRDLAPSQPGVRARVEHHGQRFFFLGQRQRIELRAQDHAIPGVDYRRRDRRLSVEHGERSVASAARLQRHSSNESSILHRHAAARHIRPSCPGTRVPSASITSAGHSPSFTRTIVLPLLTLPCDRAEQTPRMIMLKAGPERVHDDRAEMVRRHASSREGCSERSCQIAREVTSSAGLPSRKPDSVSSRHA